MSSVKEILAGIKDPKILGELKEIMASNDDEKLKSFLKTLSGDIKAKAKIKASVEEAPAETKAALIPSDYEWFRYKGSSCKNIPYADAIVCVQPDDVLGISSIVDYLGNSKVIFPAYKTTPISLSKDVLALLKNRCNAYTGDVAKLLASVEVTSGTVSVPLIESSMITIENETSSLKSAVQFYKKSGAKSINSDFYEGMRKIIREFHNLRDMKDVVVGSVEASTEVIANKGEQNEYIKGLDGLPTLLPGFKKEKDEMHLVLRAASMFCPVIIESKIKRPFRAEGADNVINEMSKRLKDVEKKFNEKYKQLYRDYFDACQKEIDKLEDDIDSKKVNFN